MVLAEHVTRPTRGQLSMRDILVTLQTGSVNTSSRGYKASQPIPFPFTIVEVYIDSNLASPDLYVKPGVASEVVDSQAKADRGRKVLDHWGGNALASEPQALALPGGFLALFNLAFAVDQTNQRLFIEVINEDSADTAKPSVTYHLREGTEGAGMSDPEFIDRLAFQVGRAARPGSRTGSV